VPFSTSLSVSPQPFLLSLESIIRSWRRAKALDHLSTYEPEYLCLYNLTGLVNFILHGFGCRSVVKDGSPSTWSSPSTTFFSSLNLCVCSSGVVSKTSCPGASCLVKKQSLSGGTEHGVLAMAVTTVLSEVETTGTLLSLQLMQIGDPSNVEHRAQESLASQIVDEPNVDSIPEKEIVRRQRIAQSNKGKVPWNKGRRHPPETIARIREKTQEAMNKPQVLSLSLFFPFSLRGSQPENPLQCS
jgi:hypothetical protein